MLKTICDIDCRVLKDISTWLCRSRRPRRNYSSFATRVHRVLLDWSTTTVPRSSRLADHLGAASSCETASASTPNPTTRVIRSRSFSTRTTIVSLSDATRTLRDKTGSRLYMSCAVPDIVRRRRGQDPHSVSFKLILYCSACVNQCLPHAVSIS